MGTNSEDYGWVTCHSESDLERKALNMIENSCRSTRRGDHVIVFVVGHGHPSGHDHGSVYLGRNLLRPEDVFGNRAVLRCEADVTLIVDACYSGVWATKSAEYTFNATFEVICGADDNTETLPCGESGSH